MKFLYRVMLLTTAVCWAIAGWSVYRTTSAAPSANPGDVVITEIMYNAASNESTTQTQYIELFNNSGSPIDVSNWTLDDEDADGPNTIPAFTPIIPVGGILVVTGSSLTDFNGAWSTTSGVVSLLDVGQTMFNLSNSPSAGSEVIQLRDELNNLIDSVDYDDASPWPSDPGGFSIALTVNVDDTSNDNGANWANSQVGVQGAFQSTISGVWDAVEVGSPGTGYTPTAVTLTQQQQTTPTTASTTLWLIAGVLTLTTAFLLRRRTM